MKDESQQQVPPGIVAYKDLRNGSINIVYHWVGTWGGRLPDYDAVYQHLIKDGAGAFAIHTISVEGKGYSVGDHGEWNFSGSKIVITGFEYREGDWFVHWSKNTSPTKGVTYLKDISKLPPPLQPVQGNEELSSGSSYLPGYDHNSPKTIWQPPMTDQEKALFDSIPKAKGYANQNESTQPPITEQGKEEDFGLAILNQLKETFEWEELTGFQQSKFNDLKQLLRLKSKPTDGWSDTQLKDFAEYCDNHDEGSMENLFKQWKSKQTKS